MGYKKVAVVSMGAAQFAYSGCLQTSDWKNLEISAVKLVTGKKLSANNFRYFSRFSHFL